jgi:uncharacterized protein YceH (UPF0502 family)
VLDAAERRVIGTLIEKGLTNPQYYPLTTSLLVSGCNQRNNRAPLTDFTDDDVEDVCRALQARGFVAHLFPATGRVGRWRQELGRVYGLNAVELAVLGELLLRGPQTEGELRQRASRMRDIPTLEALDALLAKLRGGETPFVIRLTPEGVSRGVRWTHACYPDDERERVLAAERAGAPASAVANPAAAARREDGSRVAALESRIDDLVTRIEALEARLDRMDRLESN